MISIVIPVFNESVHIRSAIHKLWECDEQRLIEEIIVCDGGSSDNTVSIAQSEGVKVITCEKGRSKQMNCGASEAKGAILYFFHADSIPPQRFTSHILDACYKGYKSGCFRLAFDHDHWFLKANAWFTRFNVNAMRFGDQSLFVSKEVFIGSGGFKEDLLMMEDQEIIHRIKKYGRFKVMNDRVTTSARKYLDNGVFRMQGIFFRLWAMYYLGCSQQKMLQEHRRLIRKHKL